MNDVASRPAKVGDKLITHKFNGTSGGFAAVGDPNVAVCLMPGTEVAFEEEATYNYPFIRVLRRFRFGKIGANMARFRQINTDKSWLHHDALEFANGKVVMLTGLRPGQRAIVLQLPAKHHTEAVEHNARAAID